MQILFVTTNSEKLKEARLALAPYGHQVESIDFDFSEPTDGAIEMIAKEKLAQLRKRVPPGMPVIVDDSGIYLVAYEGFPGILTKRIFQQIGYRGISKLLAGEDRRAYFHGVVALLWRGQVKTFHGKMHGRIIDDIPEDLPANLLYPFDPIFVPQGSELTMGELSAADRLAYSYRRKALDKLGKWLEEVSSEQV